MPKDDCSQTLVKIIFIPNFTTIIIGTEMHNLHTSKGFAHILDVFVENRIDFLGICCSMKDTSHFIFLQSFFCPNRFQNGFQSIPIFFWHVSPIQLFRQSRTKFLEPSQFFSFYEFIKQQSTLQRKEEQHIAIAIFHHIIGNNTRLIFLIGLIQQSSQQPSHLLKKAKALT